MNIEPKTDYQNLLICQAYVKMLQYDIKTKDAEIEKQKTLIRELEAVVRNPEKKKVMRKEKAYDELYKKNEEQQKEIKKLRKDNSELIMKLVKPPHGEGDVK